MTGMSARIGQAREVSVSASCVGHAKQLSVGLNIDCSVWVKSGVISEHDMIDRNWAHWTTFIQVCYPSYRLTQSKLSPTGCLLVSLRRPGLLRPSTKTNPNPIHRHLVRPNSLAPPPLKRTSTAKLPFHNLRRIMRALHNRSPHNGRRVCPLLPFPSHFHNETSHRNGLNTNNIRHEVNDELISNIEYTFVISARCLPD
jgi:hypothetical protein